jgi:hypothetical protein
MPRDRSPFGRRPWHAGAVVLLVGTGASSACFGQAASGVQAFSGRYEGRQKIALLTATADAGIELRRSPRFIVYTMHSTVTWAFIERRFSDCSVIRVEGERLLPVEYRHRDSSNPELDVHTRFDWTAGWAKTTVGRSPEPRTVEIDGSTWDPMSFQVALIMLAQQRRPGSREPHRVIERGSLKAHEVTFVGPVPATAGGGDRPMHEVVSRKAKGLVALRLLPDEAWRPARVTIDDVHVELVSTPAAPPADLPEGPVPSCEVGGGG